MLMRRAAAAFLLLLATVPTQAFDPGKSSRYPSPDMYRPNVDQITTHGPINCAPGAVCDASGTSYKIPNGSPRTFADGMADTVNVLDMVQPGDADMSAAFVRAIAKGKQVRVPQRSAGYDLGATQITVPSGVHIIFEGTSVVRTKSPSSAFRMTGFDVASSIEGHAMFDCSNAPIGSSAIRFGTSSGTVYRVSLKGLRFQHCFSAVDDEPSTSNFTLDIVTEDLIAEYTRGLQFYSRRSRGFWTIDMRVDHTRNTDQVSWGGVRFEDAAGLDIRKVDVVGPISDLVPSITYQNAAVGFAVVNPVGSVASIYNTGRILVDSTRGPGVIFSNVRNFIGGQIQVYANLGQSFLCQNCADWDTNINVVGPGSATGAINTPAVEFDDSTRITGSVIVSFSTSTGLYLKNCTDCVLKLQSQSNPGIGVVESGLRNIIWGTVRGTAGSAAITGTGSALINYSSNDGVFHAGPSTGNVP